MIILLGSLSGQAQNFWFGPKFGPSLAFQRWDNFSPNGLFTMAFDFGFESYNPNSLSSLYGQLGYHTRGSAIRTFSWQGESIGTQGYKFRNIVLELGGKRKTKSFKGITPFYHLGLRLEYTVSNNLSDYERYGSLYLPHEQFIEHWVYGATVGGGAEFTQWSESFIPFIELSINPDFSNQYFQEPIPNVVNQFGDVVNLSERRIRNMSFEIKFGFKFLRKVEYID